VWKWVDGKWLDENVLWKLGISFKIRFWEDRLLGDSLFMYRFSSIYLKAHNKGTTPGE